MRALIFLLTLLCVMSVPYVSFAQSLVPLGQTQVAEPEVPDLDAPLTQTQAESLMSRLSDSEVRQMLLDQLGTATDTAETAQSGGLSDLLYHATTGAIQSLIVPLQRLPNLVEAQSRAFSTFSNTFGTSGILQFLGIFAVLLLIAGAAELIFRHFTRHLHSMPPLRDDSSIGETLKVLFVRLCRDIGAVAVFILVAVVASRILMPDGFHEYSSLIGFYLIGFPRLAWAVGRFIMAPDNPSYRIVNASDEAAQATVFHNIWMALLIGGAQVIIQFNAMNGVPMGETRLGFWLNASVHAYLAIIVWRYRGAMTDMMRGRDAVTPTEEKVAQIFPYFAIFVTLGTWWLVNILVSYEAFGLLRTAPHYKTMGLLMFAPLMDTTIRGLVRHLVPPMQGEGTVAERAYQATKRSYIRIGRVIVFGLVLIAMAGFWGMSPASIATAGVGAQLAAALLEFLMILSIGYLLYELVSLYINRKLASEMTASGFDPDSAEVGGDGGGAGGSRLSTVLPLILAVSRVTIVVLFLLLGLSNIGVDTTPLLAGAGIVGLAIGFGAQKLVTDVVSGIFFLVDDAFRTGEYVEIDGTFGTVEKISIRSLQLRHHKGPVHTLPFGEIPKITNYSRDWVIMKLRFTVPFDTDPNKVKKIFKKIGAEMMTHDVLGEDFLQPFKSQGVLEIDDVGMVIRGKFMAKPGKQFMIRKEIFNRVSAAFAENGIDFARREVRVALPGLDTKEALTEEDKAAISAAASQAAEAAGDAAAGSSNDR
ncbi:MAG: mechanosensitive ion channel domain-containing protein [Paracoccaceae bacterium]